MELSKKNWFSGHTELICLLVMGLFMMLLTIAVIRH
jgi:hypothetical protein